MNITIYLGSRCNLNCEYCHREKDENEHGVSEVLIEKLKKERPDTIRFMGGEPTLYMDEIKRVVEACPWARFGVTTNGVLLDKYIDYFRKHNFHIIISYDGNDNDKRGYDPFCKLLDYPSLGVSCTLYHGNTDIDKIISNFSQKENIVGRTLLFYPHLMHATNGENEKLSLTKNDIDNILKSYNAIFERFWKNYNRFSLINKKYFPLLKSWYHGVTAGYQFGETYCCNRNTKKVDSHGNEWACLYIRDTKGSASVIAEKIRKCQSCKVYSMCGGACIQSKKHEIECYYYKNLYLWFSGIIADKRYVKLVKLLKEEA